MISTTITGAGEIVRFLLARLEDDRAELARLQRRRAADAVPDRFCSAERMRAEFAAKRHAIGAVQQLLAFRDLPSELSVRTEALVVLKALALPYSDHRDYRAEWRMSTR